MNIREYGEVILCRKITFEDNKYDLEKGHPGIVLLPTSEKDDNAFCLYMTTDKKRSQKEKNKYIKYTGSAVKDSYVNLQHIIKNVNNKEGELSKLQEEEFIELLEKFYDFQISLETPREEFLQIKRKIEILLDLLKVNKKLEIDNSITAKMLEDLDNIEDTRKRRKIYGTKLLLSQKVDKRMLEKEIFNSEKDRNYNEKLIYIYNKLKNINFESINLNDPNNQIRAIYLDFKNKNFLINADQLFSDVAILFDNNTRYDIQKFINVERDRLEKKQQAEETKRAEKDKRRKGKMLKKAKAKANSNRKIKEEKYGKSEFLK